MAIDQESLIFIIRTISAAFIEEADEFSVKTLRTRIRAPGFPQLIANFPKGPKIAKASLPVRARVSYTLLKALQALSWVSHWPSPPAKVPALAASAHWLC